MTKRLIDLDDDLLAAAQKELKTSGVSDTVRLALQQAAAASARARQVAWLKAGGLGEMAIPIIVVTCGDNRSVSHRHKCRGAMTRPEVAARLAPLIEAGFVATTAQLDAEALYSARNTADYEEIWSDRRLAYEYLPTNDKTGRPHWTHNGGWLALAAAALSAWPISSSPPSPLPMT